MKNAVNLLKQQQQIKEVAYQLGYKNASHFYILISNRIIVIHQINI